MSPDMARALSACVCALHSLHRAAEPGVNAAFVARDLAEAADSLAIAADRVAAMQPATRTGAAA